MAQNFCDICGVRPATVRVAVVQNGRQRQLDVCDFHYTQLTRHQRQISPFEALFGSGVLSDLLNESPAGDPALPRRGTRPGDQQGINLEQHFSAKAKEILQRAAERATQFGKRDVDSEHLLYELTESDIVRSILQQFKISPEDLRGYIEQNAQKGEAENTARVASIGISPRVKSALDQAFLSSREMGHNYVGPEHLLIGLASVPDSFAGNLLGKYGLTPQALRQQTVRIVGKGAEEGQINTPTNTPTLDKYSRDLTKLARDGKLDPVIGRSKEVETTVEILARRKKNNPVLIGEPGVGKTAIVEGLAQRIIGGDVPEVLRNKRLIELNINSLVAGAKFRGEFEERVKQVMDEITAQRDGLVLFIDEVHTIVGAGQGGGEGGLDIANVFKPAMARGEMNLIGATTLNEYQKYIEKDSALERRFQPVFVVEPTIEQTINILRGLRDRLEAHHKVTILDEALVGAAELSDRYISGRFLPDKAIDLIDQAAARVRLSTTSRPLEIQELEAEIAQLNREQAYVSARKRFDRAKNFEEQITAKTKDLVEMTEKWKQKIGTSTAEVSLSDVAEIVSKLSGIPVADLTEEEKAKLLKMEERLHERVIGQEEAIRAVSDAIRLSRAGLQQGDRPIATFLFLGPTGVGKTELAKALAEVVFGDEDAVLRIDMSEYMERHAVARLIGAPPGYVGYDEGGQLTERVRRRPYSVILLDEIEKAHADVYNVLLQVFDDGRLTDGKGRVVDFTNTLIIATSNLASDVIVQGRRPPGFITRDDREGDTRGQVMSALRQHFRPEFLNRIDEIIIFHALDREQIKEIVQLQLERVRKLARSQDIDLSFDGSLVDYLAEEGYQPEFGARELKRQIRQLLESKLAKSMLRGEVTEGSSVRCTYDQQKREVAFSVTAPQPKPEDEVPQTDTVERKKKKVAATGDNVSDAAAGRKPNSSDNEPAAV
ncbi:ATP-dependent Clp protease ATP-binding subunit [Dongia soli]|uniref:ATP-dependent Clp protease ATP-binding subunit n=1 Tax=Dongia soli TaxID=600628 RepID=A0ABU5E546_9PROT|nr:ATP-dependent Clp protease ATP-binding subunit [Dongia soli]MDY0881447.1 ATP-dependent Clp protease ATP-binding subunit [Dongia soli]